MKVDLLQNLNLNVNCRLKFFVSVSFIFPFNIVNYNVLTLSYELTYDMVGHDRNWNPPRTSPKSKFTFLKNAKTPCPDLSLTSLQFC